MESDEFGKTPGERCEKCMKCLNKQVSDEIQMSDQKIRAEKFLLILLIFVVLPPFIAILIAILRAPITITYY